MRSETMTPKTLHDLFFEQLKDIYYAEKQIYNSIRPMPPDG